MTGVDEVQTALPAVTLWNFRLASVGIQAITWVTVGLLFGLVATRALDRPRARSTAAGRRPFYELLL